MTILEALIQLRDDIKTWVANNLNQKVSISRKINGKELSADITLTAEDIGADTSGSASAIQSNLDIVSAELTEHTNNSDIHFTAAERAKLSGIDAEFATINAEVDGKADEGHGHAIADVSGLQSALDGKAAASHGTHVTFDSTNKPKMDGTAAFGTSTKVSRADHVHPTDTSRASQVDLDSHVADTTKHITSTERTNWNAAKTHADSAHAPANAEPNQNAFSNISVEGNMLEAVSPNSTLGIYADGSGIEVYIDDTPDGEGMMIKNTGVTGIKGNSESSYRTGQVNITPANIGLGNVNNTSDANKPISTAQQAALDAKVPTSRTVNGKALSANITLSASDVGAATSSHTHSNYENQNAFTRIEVNGEGYNASSNVASAMQFIEGNGIDISISNKDSDADITITNSGVRSITTGSSNGTISVNTNGTYANVAVKGLGSAAYTASSAYDAAGTAQTKAELALQTSKEYTDTVASGKSDKHDHPYLSTSTKYAASSSVGGSATSAEKMNITRITSAITDIAANLPVVSEAVYFGGGDAVSFGCPSTYCIINIKKGENHRTILDCYNLNTGDHYINGCMDTRDTTTYPWTGWKLQPNENHTHDDRYYTESEIDSKLSGKASSSHIHTAATTSADGFMSASDKAKLNGIAAGANAYSLPTANSSTLGGVKIGSNITNSNGTISLTKANVTSALGYTPPTTNTTYSNATQSAAGLMSAADKTQLDNGGIPIVTTTSAGPTVEGSEYVATVDGVTALTVGMKITIIPHVNSSIFNPRLNLNSLGAKTIRQRINTNTNTTAVFSVTNYLVANKPVTLMYDGTYWVTEIAKQDANHLYGTVPIANGGTGASTIETAKTNLEIPDITIVDGDTKTAITDLKITKFASKSEYESAELEENQLYAFPEQTIKTVEKTFANVGITSGSSYVQVTTLANMGIPDGSTIINFYIAGWTGGNEKIINQLALSSDRKSIYLIGEGGQLITSFTLVVVYI